MNKERLLALAELIEAQPHADDVEAKAGFGMSTFSHACDTPSCIAGFAAFEADPNFKPDGVRLFDQTARRYLGLDFDTGRELFNPQAIANWTTITPKMAALCLRNLVAEGKVDWPRAFRETEEDEAHD